MSISFLTHRGSHSQLQVDIPPSSAVAMTFSTEATTTTTTTTTAPSIRRRISKLTSKISHRTLRSRSPRPGLASINDAVENIASFQYSRDTSRSPSPVPSLEIRRPSGLGPSRIDWGSESPFDEVPVRWVENDDDDEEEEDPPPPPADPVLQRYPPELLRVVFTYVSHSDLPALARVSQQFHASARAVLYAHVDLRSSGDAAVTQCVSILATRREMAGLVRRFACGTMPTRDGDSTLSTVTFAIALTNMQNITALTLPRFDAHLLFHATFRLKELTLAGERIAVDEVRALSMWLANQPTLVSLSFPRLIFDPSPSGVGTTTNIDDTILCAPQPNLLPCLTRFRGPVSIAASLTPGRPIEAAEIHIDYTLYDGLRPSAVMSALQKSKVPMKRLSIIATSATVDARTLERVLMAVGAELGGTLEGMIVEWVLEDEILYKQMLSVLARFRSLRWLQLRRRCLPPSAHTMLSVPSTPTTPISPGAPPLTPRPRRITGRSMMAPELPLPRAHERAHLGAWFKQCPTLQRVVFLSDADWRIGPGVGGGAPIFSFIGHVA